MEREVINTDGKIYLASMVTEDKAPYFKLCKEIFGNDELYDRVMDTERIWASIVSGEKIVYSILDEQMNFSGDIELQNYDTRTPGIGIEIIGEKRNLGIGTAALKLFFQSTYNEKNIDYYSILIRKNNMCSRHVFEGLGAILETELENPYDEMLRNLKEGSGQEVLDEVRRLREEFVPILQYKFVPKV